MHFYTSVNVNYLPKARVLAGSVKRTNPDAYFSLVLYDDIPPEIDLKNEPFDEILTVDDLHLPMQNVNLWAFTHNVIELGTAIKGQALVDLLKRSPKVAYLDPDIIVYDRLTELEDILDTHGCVVTPHQLAPDFTEIGIEGNEVGSMLRGTFNFGFYAANNTVSGMKFATWFRDRLITHCFDDVQNGLFTDQRWGNMVPALFEDACIWRNPGCNVATWNISNRHITKDENGKYLVNGQPLLFYHFSGIDSGAQLEMVNLFGAGNPLLYELREDFLKRQDAAGQETYRHWQSKYNYYTDGEKIPQDARTYLRHHKEIWDQFQYNNPFDKEDGSPSYYGYYMEALASFKAPAPGPSQGAYDQLQGQVSELHARLAYLEANAAALTAEVEMLRKSNSWRLTKPLRWTMSKLRGKPLDA